MLRGRRSVVVLITALLLGGCSAGSAPSALTASAPAPDDDAIRMAVVGDSITVADSPDFAGGTLGPESWVFHAVGEEIALVGGWARWGATTSEMAAAVEPVDADVLVILAGTNDVGTTDAHEGTSANLRSVVDTVGAARVVLSAVPPIDGAPHLATSLNVVLHALTQEQGWEWVDGPHELREGDRFAAGMSADGLHPTEEGARLLGTAIRETVVSGGRPPADR